MVFCTLVLITGSLWAKPIWGTWWTWDSRLTTTLILWLLYGGYLLLRAMADDTPQVARFAAVIGIVAAADVPVVIVSVRLWRTIHPAVLVTRQGGHGLEDPRMVVTLLVAMVAFTALFAWILMLRFATLRVRTRLAIAARDLNLAYAAAGELIEAGIALMDNLGYLVAAYTIIFAAIFLYVVFLWRRQARLNGEDARDSRSSWRSCGGINPQ